MLKIRCTFLAAMLATSIAPAHAQTNNLPAGNRYHARYMVSGFLLRSAIVCPQTGKQHVKISLDLISSPEFKQFSMAYPDTMKAWMDEGAGNLNRGVMTDGIAKTCTFANKIATDAAAHMRQFGNK